MKSPVPDHMSFTDYYESIWETELITQVPIYGCFQFKSVQMALEDGSELATVFKEMGIHKGINHMGIEQLVVEIVLVDDPTIQCGGLFEG